jgi:ATP-dependent 26S proteasome regulatory subunit
MMTVEEKPDVTYNDVGGCKEQIEKMREVCKSFFISLLLLINLLSNSSFFF